MTDYSSKSAGFTLVETLIAVAILMVAIAGPLTIANQALISALGSRNAMIATYLAQDGMESIKNIKDNTLGTAGFDWSKVVNMSCGGDLSFSTRCSIPNPGNNGLLNSNTNVICLTANNCLLYVDESNTNVGYFYSNTTTYRSTPFTSYYYVSGSGGSLDIHSPEIIVTVVVSWSDGSIPNEIRLQELMTNVTR